MLGSDSRFLKACRPEPVDSTPVWFMRQAGRYMKEYRALRKRYSLLEICHNPELATQVTLQPIQRFDLDAAIIFADILLPLPHLGLNFDFVPGKGPVIEKPVRTASDIKALRTFEPAEELSFVCEALSLVRTELDPSIALIGFAGAPFTLASYMIEGGSSKNYQHTKALMYGDEPAWHVLMEKVTLVTSRYLTAQARAGADALQLFDSWVGALSPDDYESLVLPYSQRVFNDLQSLDVATLHFGTGTAGFLETFARAESDVVGVDWRISLAEAWQRIGYQRPIQGNLDPLSLLAPPPVLEEKVDRVLDEAAGRPGHIFNLGHGIIPATPPESLDVVIDRVRARSRDGGKTDT